MRNQKNSLVKRIMKNIFFGGLTGIISKIGAFIFTIIIARNFFPELFGVYSLSLAIILTILVLSDLGIGSTITRYLAESIGKKDKKQARSRFQFLLKYKFILSIIISLLLFLTAGLIALFFKKPELVLPLKIGSIYLFINALYSLANNVFFSFQEIKYSAITESIFQISRITLIFVSFYFFKSIEGVFVVLSLSLLISLLFSIKIITKKYPLLIKGKTEPVERRRMLKFSGFLALSSFSFMIFANIDKLVLGYFLDLKFIGFYNAIFTIVGGVLGIIGFGAIFFPVFTQLKGNRLKKIFKDSFNYISIITFPAAIGLAFIILPLLKILFGSEYVPKEYEFSLLLTSVFLSLIILEATFSSFYAILLNAKEKPKIPALTNFATSIMNVILNIIFIYYLIKIDVSYGLIGASAATFVSRYTGMVAIILLSKKTIGITNRADSITKPLFASLVMLAYLFIFSYFIPLGILTGIFMIISAAIFYFIIIFMIKAISFNEVKNLIKDIQT